MVHHRRHPGNFGVAFAETALETGDRVTLASRRPQELATWADQHGDRVLVVPLELTDRAQAQRAVQAAEQGVSVLAVEPGAFRTNAYASFANEPVTEAIPEYHDMLEQVRAVFVGMDGAQPGDPRRGARAVIAAMAQDPPPRRLVLGNGGYEAVIDALERTLGDIRANETLSRSADFPA